MFPVDPAQPDGIELQQTAIKAQNDQPQDGAPATTNVAEGNPLVTLEMTPDEVAEWWKRVERSDARIEKQYERWKVLLDEYKPKVHKSGDAEDIKVNKHFRNLHTKIGQLFYRNPEVRLDPLGPAFDQYPNPMAPMLAQQGIMAPPLKMEDIVSVKQEILNKKLGRDGIKANRLFDELLFDVLGWSGIGCSKIGYRVVMRTIQEPVMQPDPTYVPPPPPTMGLGLTPPPQPPMVPVMDPLTGEPQMQPKQIPIFEECYWRRFSPRKVVIDDTLKSTRYQEDATFLGMHFYLTPQQAMKTFKLEESQVGKGSADEKSAEHDNDTEAKGSGLIHFVELWVKASHFTDADHPLAIYQLVLMEGNREKPIVWRPSPDQTFNPQTGQLTDDSLVGFPILICTIRDLADSPFPEADSAFVNSGVKELNTFRRQSIKMRDASIGKYLYDVGKIDEPDLNKLKNGDVGDWIGVASGSLAQGSQAVIVPVQQAHSAPDDFRSQELLTRDIDETLGIGSTQSGSPEATVRSATEISAVQTAVAGRNKKEQARVIDHFLDGVRALDSLLMRYTTQDEWVHYTGQDGARRIQMWNGKLIAGRFLYDIAPDSQLDVDTAQDRQQNLNFYNLTAQDPMVNRAIILRRLARQFGYDPAKIIIDPMQMMAQPPQGGPGDAVNKHEAGKSGGGQNAPGSSDHRENAQAGKGPQARQGTPNAVPSHQPGRTM